MSRAPWKSICTLVLLLTATLPTPCHREAHDVPSGQSGGDPVSHWPAEDSATVWM